MQLLQTDLCSASSNADRELPTAATLKKPFKHLRVEQIKTNGPSMPKQGKYRGPKQPDSAKHGHFGSNYLIHTSNPFGSRLNTARQQMQTNIADENSSKQEYQIRSMVAIDHGHPQSKQNVDTIEFMASSCDGSSSHRSVARAVDIFRNAGVDEDFKLINYAEDGRMQPSISIPSSRA